MKTINHLAIWAIAAILQIGLTGCQHEPFMPRDPNAKYDTVCFETEVLPLLVSNCAYSGCHSAPFGSDGVVLNNYDNVINTGHVVPGNPGKSELYEVLNEKGEDAMPPGKPLSTNQIDLIGRWIRQGATADYCDSPCDTSLFSFGTAVKPIIDGYCSSCHSSANASGGIDLSTYQSVSDVAAGGALVGALRAESGYQAMPPGSTLSDCDIRVIEKWIEAGMPDN